MMDGIFGNQKDLINKLLEIPRIKRTIRKLYWQFMHISLTKQDNIKNKGFDKKMVKFCFAL